MTKLSVVPVLVLAVAGGAVLQLQRGAEAQAPPGPPGWAEFVNRLQTEDLALFEYQYGDMCEPNGWTSRYFFWDVSQQKAWFIPQVGPSNPDYRWMYSQGAVERWVCGYDFPYTKLEQWGPIPAQMWSEVRSGFANSTVTFAQGASRCVFVALPAWSNGVTLRFCFGGPRRWHLRDVDHSDLASVTVQTPNDFYMVYVQDHVWGRPVPESLATASGICIYTETLPYFLDLAKPNMGHCY